MMGFFLIVCGSAINIKQVGMPLYKGVALTGIKFLLGVIVGMAVSALRTGRLSGNCSLCLDCDDYKFKRLSVHFFVFPVWKCDRYRRDINSVSE